MAGLCLAFAFASSAIAAGCQEKHGALTKQPRVVDCKLDTTPLMRCPLYADYKLADATLNKHYKVLITKLKPVEVGALRKTQRQWITFRAKRCEEMQIAVKCDNAHCVGVEHDMCVLELTEMRSKQLADFIKDPRAAASSDFAYNADYPESSD